MMPLPWLSKLTQKLSWKSSLLVFLLPSIASAAFTDSDCLASSYTTTIEHKVAPFGLLQKTLFLEKTQCSIKVTHQKYKYFTSIWNIDVCRGPVHIKLGDGTPKVLKRGVGCHTESKSGHGEYCSSLKELEAIFQDDGLIYAAGEKENLAMDHGRVYCAYLLVRRYLRDGLVLSRYETYENVLLPQQEFAPVVPKQQEDISAVIKTEEKPSEEAIEVAVPGPSQEQNVKF